MNLKKYSYYTIVLLLFSTHTKCRWNKDDYVNEEKKGYYTKNSYTLGGFTSMEKTIAILSPDAITTFRKQLADRIPKWLVTGIEKNPYKSWYDFYKEQIVEKIIKNLKAKVDTTLLESYYDKLGNLFKSATEKNEKEVITAAKKLQANVPLIKAFKRCIAERYDRLEAIYLTEATLDYQQFLYFILEKNDKALRIKLKAAQSNLVKWKEDGHPTGQEGWNKIQKRYSALLKCAQLYKYIENQEAINKSLRCIDQLRADPYGLSYKDLLVELPHGIKLLKDILYETGLEEKEDIDIQSLLSYLRLVSTIA